MKRSTYIRWILSALFVAFFLSSCYTQLAVVKKKKVYVYEEKQQPVSRNYDRPSLQETDTVYYEEDENWDNGDAQIVNNYYGYPPPVSWRARYYDPYFYDDFYFYDSFYYSNYYWDYPFYGRWGWYRPVYIYDPYWHSDWCLTPGGPVYYKQRPFARNGLLARSGGRSTRISTRSRSSNAEPLISRNRSRTTSGNSSRRSIRRADDIQVIGTATPATSGRTGIKKGRSAKTVHKVVGNRKSRRSSRKYFPVSSSNKRRSTAKTVHRRKSRSVSKSRSTQPAKKESKSYSPRRRSESSRSSSPSRSSSNWSSGSRSTGSHYSPPARSTGSSRSSRSSSSGRRSSRRR